MRMGIAWLLAGILSVLGTGGCTAVDDQARYERSERLLLAREDYDRKKSQCERMGGSMSMKTRPLEQPGVTEYRSAVCVRR